jgi:hypothetical protein
VALYATVSVPARLAPDDSIVMLPGPALTSIESCIAQLTSLEPPVQCVAVGTGPRLHIAAWGRQRVSGSVDDMLGWNREAIAEHWPGHSPTDIRVVVTGAGGDIAELSWSQYERWRHEFDFPLAAMQIGPTPKSGGVRPPILVVKVSPTDPGGWIDGFSI